MDVPAEDLDPYLHKLLRETVTLDEDERKHNNKNLQKILLDRLLPEMKKRNAVFRDLFKELHYGGSFYENLRVKNANEFDINVELVLPFNIRLKEVIPSERPGFVRVHISELQFPPNLPVDITRHVIKWFDENNYLQRDKVMNWMNGVVDKALHYAKFPRKVKKWFVVPKSPDYFDYCPSLWRLSFYNQEKEIMTDLGNMKPILKLIKELRDIHNWKGLSSYYIKTIFMWEQTRHNEEFWYQSLGFLYLYMLRRLEKTIATRWISFFWDPRCNLIKKMPYHFAINIRRRITRLKRKIKCHLMNGNPEYILELY